MLQLRLVGNLCRNLVENILQIFFDKKHIKNKKFIILVLKLKSFIIMIYKNYLPTKLFTFSTFIKNLKKNQYFI